MYAKLEEDYGLAKNAMKIYDRATRAVDDAPRYDVSFFFFFFSAKF